jgi:hypothetical protein
MHTVYFSEANLWVQIEGSLRQLGGGFALLDYKQKGANQRPRLIPSMDGTWTMQPAGAGAGVATNEAAPQALNPGGNQAADARLILEPVAAGKWRVREGFVPVRPDDFGTLLGDLEPGDPAAWLSSEGLVLAVNAGEALPSLTGAEPPTGTLPALLRWDAATNKWQWRLLSQWPRKQDRAPGQKPSGFFADLDDVLREVALKLPFFEPPGADGLQRLAGEERALGETIVPEGQVQWVPFASALAAAKSGNGLWWRTGLTGTGLRLQGEPLREPKDRGVLVDRANSEVLELHPDELRVVRHDGGVEYAFIERRAAADSDPADRKPDFVCDLLNEAGSLRVSLKDAKIDDLRMLPTEEPEVAIAPPQIWLREAEGFARIEPAPPPQGVSLVWPESAVALETRDVKLSGWLKAQEHTNAPFLDLSLLVDNCAQIVVAIQRSSAGELSAQLRVWAPAFRVTFGRHACHGHGQPRADLPPHEPAGTPRPAFHPLVFLSAKVVRGAATAPFAAALNLREKKPLEVHLTGEGLRLTRWRHLSGHPVIAPVDWAVNDPAAANGPSTLRGLIPTLPPAGNVVVLVPEAGGIAIGSPSAAMRIPREFAGATLPLASADEVHFELALPLPTDLPAGNEPIATVALRRRGAPSALDAHWRRSVPPAPGAELQVPVEYTWVQHRLIGKPESLSVSDLFTGQLGAKIAALKNAADTAKFDPRIDAFQCHRVLLGGKHLFTLGVYRHDTSRICRWLLADAAGAPLRALAGFDVEPLELSEEALVLALRSRVARVDRVKPFAGPGRLILPLEKDRNDFKIVSAQIAGHVVLDGDELLTSLAGHTKTDSTLRAMTSDAVVLSAEGALTVSNPQFWFEKHGEIFSVASDQTLTFSADAAGVQQAAGLDNVDAAGRLHIRPATPEKPSTLQFFLEQRLPGLVLLEILVSDDLTNMPPLATLPGGSMKTSVAVCRRIGDGYELATANEEPYSANTKLSAEIPIGLDALTRLTLRIKRRRSIAVGEAPFVVEGGIIGWRSTNFLGLTNDERGLQVTLRFGKSASGADDWRLAWNGIGQLSTTAASGARFDQARIVFWDATLPVVRGSAGSLAFRDLEMAAPGLFDARLSLPNARLAWWCGFCALRIFAAPGQAATAALTGVFSLELLARERAAAVAFRRPATQLELWDFPAALRETSGSSIVLAIHLRPGDPVTLTQNDQFSAPSSEWRAFYFGPAAEQASREEGASTFPAAVTAIAAPPAPGIAIYGAVGDLPKDRILVGYTLASDRGETFWLRCPVRRVIELDDAAILAEERPCVWLWHPDEGRLRKLWSFDLPAARPDINTPEKLKTFRDGLLKLAYKVLAFTRWHRGAILEIPLPGGKPLAVTWELVDSPLLNRSLELDLLTRTEDPTGRPRFAQPAREFAALGIAATLRAGALPLSPKMRAMETGKRARWAGAIAPHACATIETGLPLAGTADLFTATLARAIPFEIDRTKTLAHEEKVEHFDWPIHSWAPRPRGVVAPHEAKTIAHAPSELQLALSTPRPGELASWRLTVTAHYQTAAQFSDALYFGMRTPLGDNRELDAVLAAAPVDPPATAFRDHRALQRVTWQREYPDRFTPAKDQPALLLHSPQFEKRPALSEAIWLRAALHAANRAETNARFLIRIAPETLTDTSVTLRLELGDGSVQEKTGAWFALLLHSKVAGDPPGLLGRNLRFSLYEKTGKDQTNGPAAKRRWTVAIHREMVVAPPASVEQVRGLKATDAPAWAVPPQVVGAAKELLDFGNTTVSRSAQALPALLALLRDEKTLSAFGPDAQDWQPVSHPVINLQPGAELEETLGWIVRGELFDAPPRGDATYHLVVLHADGSVQRVPAKVPAASQP